MMTTRSTTTRKDSCKLFKSLQSNHCDVVYVATQFINAKLPINQVNLELTQLLLDSCGIVVKLNKNLVENNEIDDILTLVDEKSSDICESATPLHDSWYFDRCLKFFDVVFCLQWNTFANKGLFDTFLAKLLENFATCELKYLRTLSFNIKLKFVTAYLRKYDTPDDHQCKLEVKQYAKVILKEAIFHKTVQCTISALTELLTWIEIDDSFATDENCRLIAWSIKMNVPKLVCKALWVAKSLLQKENLRDKMILFVRKLVSIFEDLCFTDDIQIFGWICACCELIYKYHRDAILPEFMHDLLDNLFAKDGNKAKSVALFWINGVFDSNCHQYNIRLILKLLHDKGPDHWKVLVDSIIEEYRVLVDCELLVKMILDEDDDAPEDTKLTLEEKEGLLRLMSYAVEQSVTGIPPSYRAHHEVTLDLTMCQNYSRLVTKSLVPYFWKLFNFEYENNERAKITLIYTAKFFSFEIIKREMMFRLMQECIVMLKNSRQGFCYQVVIDLLRMISSRSKDEEIVQRCDEVLQRLRTYCESKMIQLIEDFFETPNKYADSKSKLVQAADPILIGFVAMNGVMKLSRDSTFDIPRQLIAYQVPRNNSFFLAVLFVATDLLCKHAIYEVENLKTQSHLKEITLDNYDDTMSDIDFVVKTLILKFNEWYFCVKLHVRTFFNVCEILEAVGSLPMNEDAWNVLLPATARSLIVKYVSVMLWRADETSKAIRSKVDFQTRKWILLNFFKLIECKILPLSYAYDVMAWWFHQPELFADPMKRLVSRLCVVEEEASMVDWILKWITCFFALSSNECLTPIGNFFDLIYPIRHSLQNVIYIVIRKCIDFALKEDDLQDDEFTRSVAKHDLLNVLVKPCECLSDTQRKDLLKYFSEQIITFEMKNESKPLKNFSKFLKKKPSTRKVEMSTPKTAPVSSSVLSSCTNLTAFGEDQPMWSPSSVPRSSSIFADESDQESRSSFERSFVMFDDLSNDTSSSIISAFPAKEKISQNEKASQTYDKINELLKDQRTTELDEVTSADNVTIPLSNVDAARNILKDSANVSNNDDLQTTSSTSRYSGKRTPIILHTNNSTTDDLSNDTCSSIISNPQKNDHHQNNVVSSVLDDVSKLLKDQEMTTVPLPISPAVSSSSDDAGRSILKDLTSVSNNKDDSQTSNPFRRVTRELFGLSTISNDDQQSSNSSKSDERANDSAHNSPKVSRNEDTLVENPSQIYNDVSNLLNILQTIEPVGESAAVSVSVENVSDAVEDFINISPYESDTPTKNAAFSNEAVDNDLEQMLDVSMATVDSQNSDVPIVPNESANAVAQNPSQTTKRDDTQDKNASQVYTEVNELLKSLHATTALRDNSSSASESSQEFDIFKDFANSSNSDLDSQLASPKVSKERVISNVEDLLKESAKDEDQQSDTSGAAIKRVHHVVQSLQRVSLSNDDTDTTDESTSSLFAFDKSPFKKKRRFEF